MLQGDLGRSYYLGRDVTTLIAEALPRTLQLAAVALLFTVLIGVPLGIVSAVRKDSWLDLGSRSTALLGVSIPPFFAGLLAILIFSHYLKLLPSFGSGTWQHLVLPGITLALFSAGLVMRLTRSAMLEVLHENYIRTARAKGLSERVVLSRHALRNAAIPIITIMGLQLGSLLAGAVLTETVFGYPGIGRMLARSVFERDFPVTQGLILLIALVYVVVNVLVDILYSVLDPRIPLRMINLRANPYLREFRRSRITRIATVIAALYLVAAVAGPWIAPYEPYDLVALAASGAQPRALVRDR